MSYFVHTELNVTHPDRRRGALEDLLEVDAREAARAAREQNGRQSEPHVPIVFGRRALSAAEAVLLRNASRRCPGRRRQLLGALCFRAARVGLCISGHLR